MSYSLRIATAGSVDDGKSTLIGRLLYDSSNLPTDHLEAVERASARHSENGRDLALLTDGLRAEREQGITIDVAHRYFSTPSRSVILADTPGHVQYTRNTITGASTADAIILLVDARHGVVQQTARHAMIAQLLRVPEIILAVNKMDLVGFSEERFRQIASVFNAGLSAHTNMRAIPVCALHGDNITHRSEQMSWYTGPTLLEHIDSLAPAVRGADTAARLHVQMVLRRGGDRRYAGRVSAGRLCPGDAVTLLPSRQQTTVKSVYAADEAISVAECGRSVAVTFTDHVDVSRGEIIAPREDASECVSTLRARVAVLGREALSDGARVQLLCGTRVVSAWVENLTRLDLDTYTEDAVGTLEMNEIGTLTVHTAEPVALDAYAVSPETGSFLLADGPVTLACGVVGLADQ